MFRRNKVLIIFVRNPEKGKVKTRLAKEVGEEKALEIYIRLLRKTIDTAAGVKETDPQVWYSKFADPADFIDSSYFRKKVQSGENLGQRMCNAFRSVFREGFQKAVIIGSDCPGLTTDLIEKANEALDQHTLVVGPAVDGGYFLLGMKRLHHELFDGIPWSTEKVLQTTLKKAETDGLTVALLPELGDIDTIKDLKSWDGYEEG